MPLLIQQLGPGLQQRDDQCSGWNCLTQAEQFGIIFSIVVISVILLVAYMFYLGHAVSSHQEVVLERRRKQKKRRGGTITQLPVVQNIPTYAHQIGCQPYAPHFSSTPTASYQVQFIPGYQFQQHGPAVHPLHLGMFDCQPNVSPTIQGMREGTDHPEQPPSPSPHVSENLPPLQPTWRQRLSRMFRLPVGRASTIASSAPVTPAPSRSHSTRAHARPRSRSASAHATINRDGSALVSRYLPPDHCPNEARRMDGTQSPQTNVATVHSDDYELPSWPKAQHSRPDTLTVGGGPHPQGVFHGRPTSEITSSTEPYSEEAPSLPTTSSVRSRLYAESRPPTPVPRESYLKVEQGREYRLDLSASKRQPSR